ncbi:putative chromatin remodeling & transcription regulator BTB-POZ family [Helianthus annuus]|nr:putative chromatin remodeling & transcription regulator BTB-POZ family [Helianthus annuus]
MKINGFEFEDDLADVNIKVDDKVFRCHQVILASTSEYFKTRLSRMEDFLEGKDGLPDYNLPLVNEHDLSMEAFEKMIEYMLKKCLMLLQDTYYFLLNARLLMLYYLIYKWSLLHNYATG